MTAADFWIAQWEDGGQSVHPTEQHAREHAVENEAVIERLRPYRFGEQIDG